MATRSSDVARTTRLFAGRPHQAESKVRSATCHLRFAAATHQVARAILIGAQIRTTFEDTLGGAGLLRIEAVGGALRVSRHLGGGGKRTVIVGPVPIGAPLPDVAAHVMQSEPVGWKGLDRRGAGVPVFPAVGRRKLALPRVRR